jgi:hypothetical protein
MEFSLVVRPSFNWLVCHFCEGRGLNLGVLEAARGVCGKGKTEEEMNG